MVENQSSNFARRELADPVDLAAFAQHPRRHA